MYEAQAGKTTARFLPRKACAASVNRPTRTRMPVATIINTDCNRMLRLYFGAAFTAVWAEHFGQPIKTLAYSRHYKVQELKEEHG